MPKFPDWDQARCFCRVGFADGTHVWRASVATHLVSVVVRILCYTEEKRDRRGGVSERTGLDERKLGKGIISSLGFFHRRWHVTA